MPKDCADCTLEDCRVRVCDFARSATSEPVFVGRFRICAKHGAGRTRRDLRGPVLRPLLGRALQAPNT
eukprot:12453114-Alexandrium_andersonii.AAC.1